MSNRIDHAAEAKRVADIAASSFGQIDPCNGDMAVAQPVELQTQAHATLALVEQQRLANLIAARALSEFQRIDLREVGQSNEQLCSKDYCFSRRPASADASVAT